MQQQDDKIVVLLRKKDARGIRLAYECYGAALYGVVFRVVRQQKLAELVMCEGFTAINAQIETYEEREKFFTWTINIFRKIAFKKLKSKINDDQNIQHNPNDVSIDRSFNRNIVEDLKQEEPEDAISEKTTVMEDIYYRGIDSKELSDKLDIPLEDAKLKIRAAFKQLKKLR